MDPERASTSEEGDYDSLGDSSLVSNSLYPVTETTTEEELDYEYSEDDTVSTCHMSVSSSSSTSSLTISPLSSRPSSPAITVINLVSDNDEHNASEFNKKLNRKLIDVKKKQKGKVLRNGRRKVWKQHINVQGTLKRWRLKAFDTIFTNDSKQVQGPGCTVNQNESESVNNRESETADDVDLNFLNEINEVSELSININNDLFSNSDARLNTIAEDIIEISSDSEIEVIDESINFLRRFRNNLLMEVRNNEQNQNSLDIQSYITPVSNVVKPPASTRRDFSPGAADPLLNLAPHNDQAGSSFLPLVALAAENFPYINTSFFSWRGGSSPPLYGIPVQENSRPMDALFVQTDFSNDIFHDNSANVPSAMRPQHRSVIEPISNILSIPGRITPPYSIHGRIPDEVYDIFDFEHFPTAPRAEDEEANSAHQETEGAALGIEGVNQATEATDQEPEGGNQEFEDENLTTVNFDRQFRHPKLTFNIFQGFFTLHFKKL